MRLSIITINLNNSLGLSKTIEGVLQQKFKDFEYIIVDGLSTDNSVEIIKAFEQKTNVQFKWLSEKDTGVYNAMNKGILLSKGEYLLFLNSGDYFVDEFVLSDIFAEEHREEILCGKCNIVKDYKIIHTTNPPSKHTFINYFNATINHQSTFIKRYLFEKYGLYREDFKYNSDYDFWIKSIILGEATTKKINRVICNYNLDGMSSNETNSSQYRKEIDEILSHPILLRFIPDYKKWKNERDEMRAFYWAKSKNTLRFFVNLFYKMACFLNSKK